MSATNQGHRSQRSLARPLVILGAIIALVASACGGDSGDDSAAGDLTVVATTTVLGDVVRNVVGDRATVDVLIPIGADPHEFSPSSAQATTIAEADLVVSNGLGLEAGLDDLLDAAVDDGANLLEVGPLLDPLPFIDHSEHEHSDQEHDEDADHEEDGHDHGSEDPHVWMDPVRMADAAQIIAAELTALDDTIDWDAEAAVYASALADTRSEMDEILGVVAADDRILVTNHESLSYFADRFDFEVVGVVIPGGSTLADPSSAEIADLVAEIEEEGVPAIFAETTDASGLAEVVAGEAGTDVTVVELYTGSLGEPDSGAATLIEMLVLNAQRIADALS